MGRRTDDLNVEQHKKGRFGNSLEVLCVDVVKSICSGLVVLISKNKLLARLPAGWEPLSEQVLAALKSAERWEYNVCAVQVFIAVARSYIATDLENVRSGRQCDDNTQHFAEYTTTEPAALFGEVLRGCTEGVGDVTPRGILA